jgi:hypothetical protein
MSYSYNTGMASRTDVFKVSSALITQRLFEGKPMDDKVWMVSCMLVIIGFIAYQLLIASWLDTSKIAKGSGKVALDDVLKFSTMFVVSRVLSGGGPRETAGPIMSHDDWVKDSGLFIASLVTYDLLFHDLVQEKTADLEKPQRLAVNDALKMTTVFTMHNFVKGGEFDRAWMMSTAGFVTGFIVYDLVVSKIFGDYIEKGTSSIEMPEMPQLPQLL